MLLTGGYGTLVLGLLSVSSRGEVVTIAVDGPVYNTSDISFSEEHPPKTIVWDNNDEN